MSTNRSIRIQKQCEIERTHRVQMLETMFEVPAETKLSVTLSGELPLDRTWQVGLIVGPSGSGKTLLLKELFGEPDNLSWNSRSVIDDFPDHVSMEVITRACQSVGFNTIPAWLRPYSVLSNGEKFRAEIARLLVGSRDPILIDEFTSVVDRQVATITAHAVAKHIRESGKRLVAASCHYDIIDWLQPDWILEPGNPCRFSWRSLRPRPPITVSVSRVRYETWNLFKDFHYMSQDLNKAARCYGLYVQQSSPGLDIRLRNDVLHPRTDRDADNSGVDSRLRIPAIAGVRYETADNELLHEKDYRGDRFASPSFSSEDMGTSRDANRTSESTNEATSSKENGSELSTSNGLDKIRNGVKVMASSIPSTVPTNRIASMCGVLYRPHPRVQDIVGFTRMVTLPDFQGLGLAFVLATTVAAAYKALGKRLHSYPNHPAWIRSYQRSPMWMQVKASGTFSPTRGSTSTVGGFGGRRCAVFMYVGPAGDLEESRKLIHPEGL